MTEPDNYLDYFRYRKVSPDFYNGLSLPAYMRQALPKDKESRILDLGCGFGQYIRALRDEGYKNVFGIDTAKQAADFCVKQGYAVEQAGLQDYSPAEKFDFIIMSHVLEHIPKDKVIEALSHIRTRILNESGRLLVIVPNAQSNTGAFWAFEDFTHQFLFTSGSLYYVLLAAGFSGVEFVDKDCSAGLKWHKRLLKKLFLRIYILNKNFWNRVTSSHYYDPSPQIFSFEIKAVAGNALSAPPELSPRPDNATGSHAD